MPLNNPIIVICCDDNYVIPAMVCIYSACKNSSKKLKIYVITSVQSKVANNELLKFSKKNGLDLQVVIVDNEEFIGWKENGHISLAAYLRLLIPSIINEEKVIYLDCDILVQGDLTHLYNINTENFYLAGVEDYSRNQTYDDIYINSGVLLMNLPLLRKDNFLLKCKALQEEVHLTCNFADQTIINKFGLGKKMILKCEWNFQVMHDDIFFQNWSLIKKRAKILHFIGRVKPWSKRANPLIRSLWRKYLNESGIEIQDSTVIYFPSKREYLRACARTLKRYFLLFKYIFSYKKMRSIDEKVSPVL